MLTRAVALVGLAVVVLAGCGDGGGSIRGGEGGNELSRRLRTVLNETPALVEGRLVEDATCPNITTPNAGDTATCIVHLDGFAPPVQVDIEFNADGSFDVVAVDL
jgi:hypothetical protein